MQLSKARQLQAAWGNKPCEHPFLEKEYNLGGDTGDKVCTTCGQSFSPDEVAQIKNKKKTDKTKKDD